MSGGAETGTARFDAWVTGRVHGVGFRYFVLREAQALGVVGWVANVADGSVRCVAEGPRQALDELVRLLNEGPPASIVDNVSVAWMPATGTFGSFGVRSGAHLGD